MFPIVLWWHKKCTKHWTIYYFYYKMVIWFSDQKS